MDLIIGLTACCRSIKQLFLQANTLRNNALANAAHAGQRRLRLGQLNLCGLTIRLFGNIWLDDIWPFLA